jgi:hypothetical protein
MEENRSPVSEGAYSSLATSKSFPRKWPWTTRSTSWKSTWVLASNHNLTYLATRMQRGFDRTEPSREPREEWASPRKERRINPIPSDREARGEDIVDRGGWAASTTETTEMVWRSGTEASRNESEETETNQRQSKIYQRKTWDKNNSVKGLKSEGRPPKKRIGRR